MTSAILKDRLTVYSQLMRLDKPIGTLLLLWPTWWALWIASHGRPDWTLLLIFSLGTLLMRSAGCVINDFADRDFDGHVERTKRRPFARGVVSKKEALLLAAALSFVSFLLILPLNRLTWLMSVPALFLAMSYPFTKRFLALPQAYLGIAFGFGIPMAFAAQTDSVPAIAWWMLLGNIFWTLGYDTEYAISDKPDDLKIGIKTAAITFGDYDVAAVMGCFAVFTAVMVIVGQSLGLGLCYWLGLAVAAAMMARQYNVIKNRDRLACFKAFLGNNRVGMVIFLGILAEYSLNIH
ncbi:4-hydroxybenzoate octaprenyltransferase [Crenobacter sp. SG2303]|uniref:4-hydroxybenzoate octaprenyltransferase n=1 Tax=Crenobacter oryzisoli TaxID=3056844 RepID=A0ABT7XHX8_9NEIS|nr:4-hydroxybenzoate octaprenyltransferase [Crenobacter sp. SG2303]MDN0073343.1 4-hydroxybenzoate octaprenyltransferase [Crenobacter sp. SG2303]